MRAVTAFFNRVYWFEPRYVRDFVARNPLAAAFLISLAIHTTLFGTWRLGKALGWWEHQATWLLKFKKKNVVVSARQSQTQQQQQQQREIPLTFVEVDPVVATPEPPKEAKFYGAANSKAAEPDATLEAVKPKVDGQQTVIPRPDTVTKAQPLQPSLPPPPKEEPKEKPGDMAKAKVDSVPAEVLTVPAREKPRTLAAARQQKGLVGEKVKQDGAVRRRGQVSFDVKETPFGAYDAAFIAAVQQRWYDLLDSTQFAQRTGRVVIEFQLTHDGQIREMRVVGNEVGEILSLICQRAIKDPAPYQPWPADMRRMLGGKPRDVLFTFYYY